MRHIATAELARMTATQLESMNEQVTLYAHAGAQDSLGELIDSFDSGNLIAAGLLTQKEYRNYRGEIITIDADAILRVAATQAIAVKDKVIGRGVTYKVDGVQPGDHVQIIKLMEIKV